MKYKVVFSDAWEQVTTENIEAESFKDACVIAETRLTTLNSQDDSPLYNLEGVMQETIYLDIMGWYN